MHVCVCVVWCYSKPANALASMDRFCVCVCVTAHLHVSAAHFYKRNSGPQKGAEILGISETSLPSAVTMAKAAGGTPVFERALYSRQVHCIHQL